MTQPQQQISQEAIDKARAKWHQIALSTDPLNEQRCKEAVAYAYECAGLAPPTLFEFFGSPKAAMLRATAEDSSAYAIWGNLDAGWAFRWELADTELHLEEAKRFRGLLACAQEMGWWYPFDEAAFISGRPVEHHWDDQDRLHNVKGPAVKYSDGWSLYQVHGVRVDSWIIEEPHKLTLEHMLKEQNAEVARIMADQMGGLEEVLRPGRKGIEILDEDLDTRGGKRYLLGIKLESLDQVLKAVRVKDPSTDREYVLNVPPQIKTVKEGISWGFGNKSIDFVREQ